VSGSKCQSWVYRAQVEEPPEPPRGGRATTDRDRLAEAVEAAGVGDRGGAVLEPDEGAQQIEQRPGGAPAAGPDREPRVVEIEQAAGGRGLVQEASTLLPPDLVADLPSMYRSQSPLRGWWCHRRWPDGGRREPDRPIPLPSVATPARWFAVAATRSSSYL
jgi:hypothetical protein